MSSIWRNKYWGGLVGAKRPANFAARFAPIVAILILALHQPILHAGPRPEQRETPSCSSRSLAPCARRVERREEARLQDRSNRLLSQTDLAIADLIVTQAVNDEPLIVGKPTLVRVVVKAPDGASTQAQVTVDFGGETYSATETITPPSTTVDINVDPPSAVAPVVVNAQVQPAGDLTDPDPSDNSKSATLAVVQPNQKIEAYFLPVDWTPEQMQRYDFPASFEKFVREQGDFLRGAYPLGVDQITLDYSVVPHMLAADEKRLTNSQGDEDIPAEHLLYASIALAGRRLAPGATLIVGIFPPGWFAQHGDPGTLGLSLRDVPGTVTDQYLPGQPLVTAHELAHQFWLYEDYDYSVKPPKPFTYIDRPGYWVQQRVPEISTGSKRIPTFLSASNPGVSYWVDTRIYEYLMAKFTIGTSGQTSGPLVLSATMARGIEPGNYPSNYAAGFQTFAPKQPVYCSVAAANVQAGQTLEARWFLNNSSVKTERQTTQAGSAWYAFALSNRRGLAEGSYRVEIYLDGQLVKTSLFTVKNN